MTRPHGCENPHPAPHAYPEPSQFFFLFFLDTLAESELQKRAAIGSPALGGAGDGGAHYSESCHTTTCYLTTSILGKKKTPTSWIIQHFMSFSARHCSMSVIGCITSTFSYDLCVYLFWDNFTVCKYLRNFAIDIISRPRYKN